MQIVAILVWILLFGFVSVGLRLFILCGYGCCVLLHLRFDCLVLFGVVGLVGLLLCCACCCCFLSGMVDWWVFCWVCLDVGIIVDLVYGLFVWLLVLADRLLYL